MLPGLLALVRAAVELAEAQVAVGDEGAHDEFAADREFIAVGAFGCLCQLGFGGGLANDSINPRLGPRS
jgi:hypothetical protein